MLNWIRAWARRLSVSALLLSTTACALPLSYDNAITVIPYTLLPSGRIVVEVGLNGDEPFAFALDTASSGSFVFSELREYLDLPVVPGLDATVRGAVATGRFPVVSFDTLRIGDEIWSDGQLIALPGTTEVAAGIDGILGVDFLRRYAVGFSVADGVIRLYEPRAVSERSYQDWTQVQLRPMQIGESAQPLYFFDVNVAGNEVAALFDLGAGVNILNVPASERLDLRISRRADGSVVAGAVGTQAVLAQFDRQVVITGRVRWRNEPFLIGDLEVFETLGFADRPLAILGSGLFTQRDFIIDFVRDRLLVRHRMPEQQILVVPSIPAEL